MRIRAALACAVALALCAAPAGAATPWRAVDVPDSLGSVTFGPPGSGVVYATTNRETWRSDDHGATWSVRGRFDTSDIGGCLGGVSPADPATVYSCRYVSTDAGAHWRDLPSNLMIRPPMADAGGALYASSQNQTTTTIYRCARDGTACTFVFAPGLDPIVAVDPASNGLLVRYGTGGVSASRDAGATWTAPHPLPPHLWRLALSFDGRVPGKLFLTAHRDDTDAGLVAVSLDAGASWSPLRPLPRDDYRIIGAGGVGAQRRVWLQDGGHVAWTTDNGVTFTQLPGAVAALAIDPDDGAHLFQMGAPLRESRDGGASWTMRHSAQFGRVLDDSGALTGSGSTLYTNVAGTGWASYDAGATWAPMPGLEGRHVSSILASRDNPAVAYAIAYTGDGSTDTHLYRTTDAGRTWNALPRPPGFRIVWIESGHPDWVAVGDYAPPAVSHDGGATWTTPDDAGICRIGALASKPVSPANCGPFAVDPLRAPWDQAWALAPGVVVDRTGAGAMYSLLPLGRVRADWTFESVCTQLPKASDCVYAEPGSIGVADVWASGGHVTYVTVGAGIWARRDDSRWYLLEPPPGSAQAPYPSSRALHLLGHDSVVANGLLVPLQAPVVGIPRMGIRGLPLYCTSGVNADAADFTYGWLRDGRPLAGERSAEHQITLADEGHRLACQITARNAWGSDTGTSVEWFVSATGAVGAAQRLRLSGLAAIGTPLRCSAGTAVTWLRDGRAIAGAHARTYVPRVRDEGHALACRARLDGTFATSAAVRIPKPRGGRSLLTP